MKKIGLSILVLCALALLVSSTYEMIAKSTLARLASDSLKTEVSIGSLDISPFSGTAHVSSVRIANPDNFSKSDAITIPSIYATLDLKSVLSDTVLINEIRVEGLNALLEFEKSGHNLKALQRNMAQKERVPSKKSDSESKTAKTVIIERLRFTDMTVRTALKDAGELASVDVKDLTLTDIGRGQSMTTAETMNLVLGILLENVIKASTNLSLKAGLNKVIEGAEEVTDGISNSLKSLFE